MSSGRRSVRILRELAGVPGGVLWDVARRDGSAAAATGRRLRLAFERLGPAFVKVGQFISTRPDVFPGWLVTEMDRMRDRVPPASERDIDYLLRRQLGRRREEYLAELEPAPTAAASVAQVHRAVLRRAYRPVWGRTLPSGTTLAIKVVRPGAVDLLKADIDLLGGLLRAIGRLGGGAGVDGDLANLLQEMVCRETNLRREASVADRFGFLFRGESAVLVPRIVWPLTTERVMTMEFIDGWHLDRLDQAAQAGVDVKRLAYAGAEAFMRQVLVHGIFHADLHHANLLVTPTGRIAYLDFGIHGTLAPGRRLQAVRLMGTLLDRDVDGCLDASSKMGISWPPGAAGRIRRDLGALMEASFRGGGGDLKHFGLGLLAIFRREGVRIPAEYLLLVKALITVEGVSRALNPELDMLHLARPFITSLRAGAILFGSGEGARNIPLDKALAI